MSSLDFFKKLQPLFESVDKIDLKKEPNQKSIRAAERKEAKTVFDPITKKNVPVKSIKQQAGGPVTKNGVPFTPAPSEKWKSVEMPKVTRCLICTKRIKENTHNDTRYCQGHQ